MRTMFARTALIALCVLLLSATAWAENVGIYWTDGQGQRIQKANLDGSGVTGLVKNDINTPRDVEYDAVSGKMYWCEVREFENWGHRIMRSNADGTNVEELLTGLDRPVSIALDAGAGKMYWADDDKIRRANLDGSGMETLLSGLGDAALSVAVDPAAGKMYWSDTSNFVGTIRRANLDGSGVEDLITGIDSGCCAIFLAIDSAGGKLYYAAYGGVHRANLDGSNVELVDNTYVFAYGIQVDSATGKVYWSADTKIVRANLDGTALEDVIPVPFSAAGIALDLGGGGIYWTDASFKRIQLGDPGNASVQDVVARQILSPRRITIDTAAGKMYWADLGGGVIHRANLDGTGIEDVVTVPQPCAVAVDPDGGKMYWINVHWADPIHIRRCSLDGSNVEDLYAGVNFDEESDLALDMAAGKMYWSSYPEQAIYRANLDGSAKETVVTVNTDGPRGMALDLVHGKVYWTSGYPGRVDRANLDGTGMETVVTVGNSLSPIVVDAEAGKVYWGERTFAKIQRSDLDGTNVEDVVQLTRPGSTEPYGDPLGLALFPDVTVPTLLQSFDARSVRSGVEVAWLLVEAGLDMTFTVFRADDAHAVFVPMHDARVTGDRLAYRFVDESVMPGRAYTYRVDVSDEDGAQTLFVTQPVTLPALALALDQNHPNPFNPSTTISFVVPVAGPVELAVYDTAGRRVATLINAVLPAGADNALWDGHNDAGARVATGVYYYRLRAGKEFVTRKMVLLK